MGRRNLYVAATVILFGAATATLHGALRNKRSTSSGASCLVEPDSPSNGNGIVSVTIIYATEWGTSERLADRLCYELRHWPCVVQALAIEDFDADTFDSRSFVIFVASTVGQGEAPANAHKFLQILKRREVHIDRALLIALGHSAFSTFCHFGIELFNKLQRFAGTKMLTASPVLIDCADDSFETKAMDAVLSRSDEILQQLNPVQAAALRAKLRSTSITFVTKPGAAWAPWCSRERGKPLKSGDKPLFEAMDAIVTHRGSVESDGRRIHVINLACRGMLDVTVGHAVRIWTPASNSCVDLGFRFLPADVRAHRIFDQTPSNGRLLFPRGMAVSDVLRYIVDWTATPSEEVMTRLLTDLGLADKVGRLVAEVTRRRATLEEFLLYVETLRDSNAAPLSLSVLAYLPRVAPRSYTIASNVARQGVTQTFFDLCITEVMTERSMACLTELPSGSSSGGTDALKLSHVHHGRVSQWLRRAEEETTAAFPILVTTTASVCGLRHALQGGVWCGAGSGCALFRAFVLERKLSFERLKRVPASGAKTSVYLSLRTEAEFQLLNTDSAFQFAVAEGLVKEIYLCFTRGPRERALCRVTAEGLSPIAVSGKTYIGAVLERFRPEALDLLFQNVPSGNLIVCGGVWLKDNILSVLETAEVAQLLPQLVAEVW